MDESVKNNAFNIEFDRGFSSDDYSIDATISATDIGVQGANATMAGLQTQALQDAMNNYAQALNDAAIAKSTGLPVKTPSAQYKGFAAEEYYKLTLKINALAKGIPDWKIGAYTKGSLPDETSLSGIDMETDIAIFTRKNPWDKPKRTANYQAKMHNNPADYQKDLANPQYDNVDFVGGEGQGVNDKVTVEVGDKTVSSDSITPEDATKLADDMKAQNVPEYQHAAEKQEELNRVKIKQAVSMGAATGFILSTIKEVIYLIKEKRDLPEEQWIKSLEHILCGTVEGGIRGGAIAGSVQLLGKALGKEITENSIGAIPAMAIANTAVDFAKDVYKTFVSQKMDTDDLLCNTVNNMFSSFAGFGGSWVGAQIAGSYVSVQTAAATGASIGSAFGPLGTVIGSLVGGLVIGYGATIIIGTANKDAQAAFNKCISDINEQVEGSGCDTLFYFAESMSELSKFELSFKNLLPCYNLISDLREYNLRKKAMKQIRTQLDEWSQERERQVEDSKREAFEQIAKQHEQRLVELKSWFEAQRTIMHEQFRESVEVSISNAYVQYVSTFNFVEMAISTKKNSLEECTVQYNRILNCMSNRNAANAHLNEVLNELMNDPDTIHLVRPMVNQIYMQMQKDELMLQRQYLSFSEALSLQGVKQYDYVG